MPTIIEVAERAKVSIATVSNVIRGTRPVSRELEDRVRQAIAELDYFPNEIARSLKVKRTRMLGMIVPDITNPFFPEIIRGAEDIAFERGYLLVAANTDEQLGRERRIISALRSYRVGGILLASATGKDASHLQSITAAGIPIVSLDRAISGLKVDAVLLDNVRGSHECVRHLIQMGHTSIAIVTGPLTLQTGLERLRGYEDALAEAGIKLDRSLIYTGDFREGSGLELGKVLLQKRKRPSAIFVCNGLMASGVLQALEEMNVQCPRDIALATFDDLAVDRSFHPHLTAVVQPSYDIGSRAATMLVDRIEGRLIGEPLTVRVVPTLITRESTNNWKPHKNTLQRSDRMAY